MRKHKEKYNWHLVIFHCITSPHNKKLRLSLYHCRYEQEKNTYQYDHIDDSVADMEYTMSMKTQHGGLGPQSEKNARTNIVQQNVKNFFSEVSIAGAKYTVMTSASYVRRAFWLVLVLLGIGFCLFQIIDRIQHYMDRPTSANIKINHVGKLRFPTVTICNENKIVKSKLLAALG